jgi:transcriptional regulator with XRE-family HTH domain
VSYKTARTSPSRHLESVPETMRFRELLRRRRLEKGWTQAELAEHLQVRTQTVSGWERGVAPQRRFYAQLAGFLRKPDELAIEGMLAHDKTGAEEEPATEHPAPAPRTGLQERVVEVILDQLERNPKPSTELAKLFRELMAWANQPAPEPSDDDRDDTADPGYAGPG